MVHDLKEEDDIRFLKEGRSGWHTNTNNKFEMLQGLLSNRRCNRVRVHRIDIIKSTGAIVYSTEI